jgi:hypothetical protein
MWSHVFFPFIRAASSQLIILLLVTEASAQLKFYYDPDTGNVAFDTTSTRNGKLYTYLFELNPRSGFNPNGPVNLPWEFRAENLIRLSQSTFYAQEPRTIGDTTQSTGWRGLYTIGDVMPIGLTEEFWKTAFVHTLYRNGTFAYGYVDVIGGGDPPAAQFIYGRPTGEFKNKWDLVDPATLNWATAANLVYFPLTGEVVVDTSVAGGGYFSALILESASKFNPAGFDPFFQGPFVDATSSLIGLFGDAFEPGRYSLGSILPTALTQSEFEAVFDRAEFLGRAGFKSQDFNFEAQGLSLSLQYVPEPSVLPFLVTACGSLACCLRKRALLTNRLKQKVALTK